MLKEQFDQAVQVFQSLDGIQQAVFSFWGLCVAMFYGTLIYLLFLIGKEGIKRLTRVRS